MAGVAVCVGGVRVRVLCWRGGAEALGVMGQDAVSPGLF